ncbi:MAG: hypothetical protein, partial [Olavius algarvensis Gamma 3 endosymbiont]
EFRNYQNDTRQSRGSDARLALRRQSQRIRIPHGGSRAQTAQSRRLCLHDFQRSTAWPSQDQQIHHRRHQSRLGQTQNTDRRRGTWRAPADPATEKGASRHSLYRRRRLAWV